jgi:hypothetical protein
MLKSPNYQAMASYNHRKQRKQRKQGKQGKQGGTHP